MGGKKMMQLLTVFLTITMLVLFFAGPSAAKKVRFVYSGKAMAFFNRIVATELDLFAKEGLDIEVTNIPGGSKAAAALLGGSADVVDLGFLHCLKAARKAFDVVAFYSTMNSWPSSYMMKEDMMKKAGITMDSSVDDKIRAMKGLTIGCTSMGSGTHLITSAILKNRGVNPETDVKFFPFGKWKAGAAAFETGKIDVYQWITPTPEQMEAKGIGRVTLSAPRGDIPELKNYPWGSLFTTREFMDNNPDVLLKFSKAMIRAARYIHNNKADTIKIMAKVWEQYPKDLLGVAYENMSPGVPLVPKITLEGWQKNMDVLFAGATKEEQALMAYDKIVNNSFVEKALKELGQ
jgi:NitT/TauT family transport system substrate-binding protein